jgi:hypothetical protein
MIQKNTEMWERTGGIYKNVTTTLVSPRPLLLLSFQISGGNENIKLMLKYS